MDDPPTEAETTAADSNAPDTDVNDLVAQALAMADESLAAAPPTPPPPPPKVSVAMQKSLRHAAGTLNDDVTIKCIYTLD